MKKGRRVLPLAGLKSSFLFLRHTLYALAGLSSQIAFHIDASGSAAGVDRLERIVAAAQVGHDAEH